MKPAPTKAAPRKTLRESDAYLHRLGERVRMLRSQRAMSRKVLARQAKVSERYIAQLEAGLGNCSIVLLRRIARAIGMPVTQLVHDGSDPPLDLVLLTQFLERLPPEDLVEARRILTERFRSLRNDQPEQRNRIALIGLRGGGKSTLGALLAEQMDAPFIELDREVERRSGAAPSERRAKTCSTATTASCSRPAAPSSPSRARWKCCCRRASPSGSGRSPT